ncbi:PHP domain-containing protein [Agrococcus sp. SGAir0287]|uniref:PHP domain-containing protein n=1 Tax=Agrococcus sp. SGAir0287 TaxID=2070347 RepID=UPI0010CD685B|nr:PHP domain-containing protein [Agrococcus sp. SGAir0287]QCR18878.1 phosphatase [Agrococcus sp. SGAir0287]
MTPSSTPGSGTPWGRIDLHAHSTESDGTESPRELVLQAHAAGIDTVAITDHDTTSGWEEAAATARELGMGLVPGVEFSAQQQWASVHVLGYLLDPAAPAFLAERERIRVERVERARRMVERIGADHPLTWQDVQDHAAPGATIGRPHIADALVTLGIVPDRSAAFDGILHWRGGYYQPHRAPAPSQAVRIIRAAGGVPVIAHPAARGQATMDERVIAELVDAGLLGLEVEHRDNPPEARAWLREQARIHGLITTGSSDWHGRGKPNAFGEHTTSAEALDAIVEAATGAEPTRPR